MLDHDNLDNYRTPVSYDLESSQFKAEDSWLLALAQAAAGPVLELGAGTGGITIPLAQQGIALTALEVAPQMLAHARAKAGDLPIRWVLADVRNFHLGQRYPLIFTCGGVISHLITLAEREAMLQNVWQHLTAEGHFVLDGGHAHVELPVDSGEEEWYAYTDSQGRQVRVTGYDRYDHAQQIWHQTFFRRWQTAEGVTQTEQVRLALHYWLPQEMETLLAANGFRIVTGYANWLGAPPTAENPATVYVCAKLENYAQG